LLRARSKAFLAPPGSQRCETPRAVLTVLLTAAAAFRQVPVLKTTEGHAEESKEWHASQRGVGVDILEQNYRANPPLFIMAKGGETHVFLGGALPKGGITRSLCNARPPMIKGDPLDMFEILPSRFHAVEDVAPQHWKDLERYQQAVSCQACRSSLERLVGEAWRANSLMQYTNGYGFELAEARAVIIAIPAGRWAAQSDIAAACGGGAGGGFAVRRMLNMDQAFAQKYGHRVLYDDGSGGAVNALVAEGVLFDPQTRHPDEGRRLSVEALVGLRQRR